jgi:hypothetical protein
MSRDGQDDIEEQSLHGEDGGGREEDLAAIQDTLRQLAARVSTLSRGGPRPPTPPRRRGATASDDGRSDAGRSSDDGRSSASTMDPFDVDVDGLVGPPDPLLQHDPAFSGLSAQQHHILKSNPGSLSFREDGAHLSMVSKSLRVIAELVAFIAAIYELLPPEEQERAADLQANAVDTKESLCFVLDEYVLRAKHTREQAKTVIDAARAKHGSKRPACGGLAFSSPGVADLYADMEAQRAKEALKAISSKTRRGADDDDDKAASRLVELEKANKAANQRNNALRDMVKKHEPDFDFKTLSTRQSAKTTKTAKTAKTPKTSQPAAAADLAPAAKQQ